MKSQELFDYEQDIEEEMVRNHQNLIALFQQKFQVDIQTQNNLIINNITDSQFKTKLMEYIKLPEILEDIQKDLKNDVFISEFMRLSRENQKNYPGWDKQMNIVCEKLQKKAINENEPLTFFNEYVDMSDKIQSCFLLRKGIKEEVNNQDEKAEVLDGKCGLKMKKYIKKYRYDYYCGFCINGFKNQSGLKSHQNTCKMREKVKKVVTQKRQTKRRCSKKVFKTLDEERLLK